MASHDRSREIVRYNVRHNAGPEQGCRFSPDSTIAEKGIGKFNNR